MIFNRFYVWNLSRLYWERNRFAITDDGCLLMQVDDVSWEPFHAEHQIYYSTGLNAIGGAIVREGDYVLWGHIPEHSETAPRVAVVRIVGGSTVVFSTINLERKCDFDLGSFMYARFTGSAMEVLGHKCEMSEKEAVQKALELVNFEQTINLQKCLRKLK
jgi:hypothetical protein